MLDGRFDPAIMLQFSQPRPAEPPLPIGPNPIAYVILMWGVVGVLVWALA